MLVEAGILVVDGVGPEGWPRSRRRSGPGRRRRRLHGDGEVARGRALDADDVARRDGARPAAGLATQLESFTHNSTEFLRREQDLLLHGRGRAAAGDPSPGRPVVVVVRGHEAEPSCAGSSRSCASSTRC